MSACLPCVVIQCELQLDSCRNCLCFLACHGVIASMLWLSIAACTWGEINCTVCQETVTCQQRPRLHGQSHLELPLCCTALATSHRRVRGAIHAARKHTTRGNDTPPSRLSTLKLHRNTRTLFCTGRQRMNMSMANEPNRCRTNRQWWYRLACARGLGPVLVEECPGPGPQPRARRCTVHVHVTPEPTEPSGARALSHA